MGVDGKTVVSNRHNQDVERGVMGYVSFKEAAALNND